MPQPDPVQVAALFVGIISILRDVAPVQRRPSAVERQRRIILIQSFLGHLRKCCQRGWSATV